MQRQPDQPADQRAVDADELEVAPDRAFHAVGQRRRVPAAYRLAHQLHDLVAIARGDADGGAAGEAVDLLLQAHIVAQRPAQFR